MKYVFSATVEQVHCHIRSFMEQLISESVVSDRPHKHYFMEFHWVFSGEETISLPDESRQIRLMPGQILLLPRGIYHGVTTNGGTVGRMCFNFSAEPLEKGSSTIWELYQNIREVLLFEDPAVNVFMEQCRRLATQPQGPMTRVQQGMLLLSVVLQLLDSRSDARIQPVSEGAHTLRQKWIIEEYIERTFTDSTGIEGLAQALYLSQRQTRTLVRRFMGEDYKSIIIRRRMELAEIYLRDPEKSLEEIAWLVGYRSYSGFQLCFKRYFGTTPSEKRKQLQEISPG